jgi:hypothetical protein
MSCQFYIPLSYCTYAIVAFVVFFKCLLSLFLRSCGEADVVAFSQSQDWDFESRPKNYYAAVAVSFGISRQRLREYHKPDWLRTWSTVKYIRFPLKMDKAITTNYISWSWLGTQTSYKSEAFLHWLAASKQLKLQINVDMSLPSSLPYCIISREIIPTTILLNVC